MRNPDDPIYNNLVNPGESCSTSEASPCSFGPASESSTTLDNSCYGPDSEIDLHKRVLEVLDDEGADCVDDGEEHFTQVVYEEGEPNDCTDEGVPEGDSEA